ncbi:flagellar basal body-associated protein FliL [Aquicoccus porphyridii]|uniref:Flagellar basal body-associated protein FliL n=1 Tax=Aquicoccus porphyridii TaxID=1852029 RepID=A0A5A9YXD5_9RHOB|nr:flagellar basal body-associated protein FliL [Aquicoccus porphyridii]KAA0909643.1 flagellar basal body-associated protein FliL [Aquicoccus porphyridii]RAI54469.1 flagellar basal body-associated protein FliL [Rhodobacteraceae bacterium AsT-22]
MLKMLIPLLLLAIGMGAGIGGGLYLRPDPPADETAPTPSAEPEPARSVGAHDSAAQARDYIKLNNQFIVPVVEGEKVMSLVVLTLGVEIPSGQKERLYLMEPKVRDVFLQELFAHANRGGFRGAFTSARNLDDLRSSLREAAQYALGDLISDILIIDIVRQDN